MKALIADDDVFVRKCIIQMLPWQELDFSQVLEAGDGAAALKMALEETPDLIISDVKMPVLNGLELVEKLRSSMVDVSIIMLSEYSDFEFVQNALKLGVQDYILKPITRERLNEICDKIRQTMDELQKKRYYTSLRSDRAGIRSQVQEMLENGSAQAGADAFEYMALHRIYIEDLQNFGMLFLQELFEQAYATTFQKAEMKQMESAAMAAYSKLKNVADVISFVRTQCEKCTAFCARSVPQTIHYVEQIDDYIEKNYADFDLSVATISDWLHLSPVYTGALYKQHQGKNIITSIHEVRLRHAKELLMDGSVTVTNVSKRVGYMTPDYFSRLFSASVGVSPSQYRTMMMMQGKEGQADTNH